jgi:hypothetical protein
MNVYTVYTPVMMNKNLMDGAECELSQITRFETSGRSNVLNKKILPLGI